MTKGVNMTQVIKANKKTKVVVVKSISMKDYETFYNNGWTVVVR